MPMDVQLNLPQTVPALQPLTLDSWKKGVITLIDKSRIPRDALTEMQNLILAEDGVPTVRPGLDWFGVALPNEEPIDGADAYEKEDGSVHLLAVGGGVIYRSDDYGQTWDECTGATFTAGEKVWMVQDHGYMYMTSGGASDNIIRYDSTTTLVTYTALATPGAPSIAETGLTGTGYNYYYKVSAVNAVGFTAASPASLVVQSSTPRANWDASNFGVLTIGAITNATRYDVYISENDIDYFYLTSVTPATVGGAGSYRDDGSDIANTNITAPTENTTQGPKVKRLEQIGSRLWGVEDYENPWRVWWSGSDTYAGYFSSAYDGGWIDLMSGSQYRPVRVVDYRDGKGTPYATVWMRSADGLGCIWQITLETLTIGEIAITVPAAYRLPGSRGTDAPGSVVNVLNSYHFYNSQAFYSFGSDPKLLQILSTDELSANIRPTVKQISSGGAPGIASIYTDAKVFYSVPYGSMENNATIVFDTERNAWIPEAFTVGFERFFKIVEVQDDGTKYQRLLAWKPGDNRLTQISENIRGDYNVAFNTSLVTGLYPMAKDRFEFMWVEDAEVEFSQPQSTIFVELIGIERSRGFSTQSSETIEAQVSNVGWSTFSWSSTPWTDTSEVPETFSESSVKRYFRVLRELNAYQWRITTTSTDANYLLRTLQLKGTITQGGKPRGWRL